MESNTQPIQENSRSDDKTNALPPLNQEVETNPTPQTNPTTQNIMIVTLTLVLFFAVGVAGYMYYDKVDKPSVKDNFNQIADEYTLPGEYQTEPVLSLADKSEEESITYTTTEILKELENYNAEIDFADFGEI